MPSVVSLWAAANWFGGSLRRGIVLRALVRQILTDYGLLATFPQVSRWSVMWRPASTSWGRVVYEPVSIAADWFLE